MLEEAIAEADAEIGAGEGPPVLVTGERALASRRRRADRRAAQGALPPAGLRHRASSRTASAPARAARSPASTSATPIRARGRARHPRQGRRPCHGGRPDGREGAARRAPRLPRGACSAAPCRARRRRTASPVDAALIGAGRHRRPDRDGRARRAVRRRAIRSRSSPSRRTSSPMSRRTATAMCG